MEPLLMSATTIGCEVLQVCRCHTACCLKLRAFERFSATRRESQKSCAHIVRTNDCFGQLGRLWTVTGKPEVEKIAGRGGATMSLPGETEAGSAGKRPGRGITRWAHRDDDRSAKASL